MNELTRDIQKMMVPKAAIIAYQYEDRMKNDSRYFLEVRAIGKNGQMGAGTPVTYEFMNTLLESYTEEMSRIPAGRNPENPLESEKRTGRIYLVQSARKKTDVLSKGTQYTGRHIQPAGDCLSCKKRRHGRVCFQGKSPGGNYAIVPCPILQRDRIKCLPWQQFTGRATEPDFSFLAGILGKTVLAD